MHVCPGKKRPSTPTAVFDASQPVSQPASQPPNQPRLDAKHWHAAAAVLRTHPGCTREINPTTYTHLAP